MDVIPRNDYGERCQFDAYCKLVLYHEAVDYLREMQRRRDRELSFSDLPQAEMDKLYTVDRYPSDRFTFSSHGYDLHIGNELVADAFAGLSSQEQSILILHCVLELPDQEIGRLVGMSRSSVQRRRTKSLSELRIKLMALASLQARDEELDGLFERIYEDNVSGKLSDDRFAKMSRRYEQEQKELAEKIKALRSEMDKLGNKAMTSDMFISTVRKYTRAKKLTPRMKNELIDRIEVHQAEKINGKWEQRLITHYNCVGAIFIPDVFPLPAPQVSVNTRKGVVVNYAPCQIAI